jgi:hypothetical protein
MPSSGSPFFLSGGNICNKRGWLPIADIPSTDLEMEDS